MTVRTLTLATLKRLLLGFLVCFGIILGFSFYFSFASYKYVEKQEQELEHIRIENQTTKSPLFYCFPVRISREHLHTSEPLLFPLFNGYGIYGAAEYKESVAALDRAITKISSVFLKTLGLCAISIFFILLLTPLFIIIFLQGYHLRKRLVFTLTLLSTPFLIFISLILLCIDGNVSLFAIYDSINWLRWVLLIGIIISSPLAFIIYSLYKGTESLKEDSYLLMRKWRGETFITSFFYYLSPAIISSIFRNDKIWILETITALLILEYILNIPGVGTVTIAAVISYDYPMIFVGMSCIVLLSFLAFFAVDFIVAIVLWRFLGKFTFS